jgi:hypothetical protein
MYSMTSALFSPGGIGGYPFVGPPPPWTDPFYNNNFDPYPLSPSEFNAGPNFNAPYPPPPFPMMNQMRQRDMRQMFMAPIDVDAMDVTPNNSIDMDADRILLDEMERNLDNREEDEEEWMSDAERRMRQQRGNAAQQQQQEQQQQQQQRPNKNVEGYEERSPQAASDTDFRGRRPGQSVNGSVGKRNPPGDNSGVPDNNNKNDDDKLTPEEEAAIRLDRAKRIIVEAIDDGVPAYNAGDVRRCCTLYEDAAERITDLVPSLYRSQLLEAIGNGEGREKNDDYYKGKAWALRRIFDSLMSEYNNNNSNVGGGGNGRRRRDPRERHVILDEFDNPIGDPFARSRMPPRPPPPGGGGQQVGSSSRRPGPSVYTLEEEELINAMGGRQRLRRTTDDDGGGPRTTQEFAGLGNMSRERGRADRRNLLRNGKPMDPTQRNYNPDEPIPGVVVSSSSNRREEGYLGDSTLREISLDYGVPIPYLADVIANWGIPVPIDPNVRLGDMVTGEQAFAILEAIHTLDVASLHDRYSEEDLLGLCDCYDINLQMAFEFCLERGYALPFGVRTFLRVEQEEDLISTLG